ncbi:MAG: phage tail tape measure protein, partial [Muribaculaceae bacterium]|nr:phage tail tape measure protein [Muribaculaceae bacterium]
DVQGYVEAADIINVALVDLGSGATQTIAKLTNIFGVEEMLGTKEAMLAVGSTVNVLSQNCTASKPYLVEFAQRMAGIGSQAGLTIPQILAFGAVLDANGQKVEMSATAIQKVIMNLANKNHEFAATLGIDAELLNQTLKHSAKDGLLMFLEALQKMGQDVGFENATMTLAPAFKDMGLDAARVSQVLSTLAMHLDEVKWQMGEADRAFNEASSATNEYIIFNNTAQASIDKAKKRVSELAIELGEKLYPIMKHIYTSSGVFLRVLNKMVTFFVEHRTAILTITGALIAYNAALAIHNSRTAIASKWTVMWKGVMVALHGILPPIKLIIAGLTNTVQYFTNGLEVNYTMQQRWSKALKAMSFANWAGLAVAAIAAVVLIFDKLSGQIDKTKRKFTEAIGKMGEFDGAAKKEREELDKLFGVLKGAREGSEALKSAKDKLISQYGSYLKGLINERGEVTNLEEAYKRLADAIRIANQERGIKNAREAVENTFKEEMQSLSSELYRALLDYGVEVGEAAQIQAAVITAMEMGVPIDEGTVNRINELGLSGRVAVDGATGRGARLKYNGSAALHTLTGGLIGTDFRDDPGAVVMRMYDVTEMRDQAMNQIDITARKNRPLRILDDNWLDTAIQYAEDAKTAGGSVLKVLDAVAGTFEFVEVSADEAQGLLRELTAERAYRGGSTNPEAGEISDGGGGGDYTPPPVDTPTIENTDRFAAEKDWRERAEARARIDYATGISDYIAYTREMDKIAVQFCQMQLMHTDLTETERLSITAQYNEAQLKQQQHFAAASIEAADNEYNAKMSELKQFYIDGQISKETYDQRVEELEIEHQQNIVNAYTVANKSRVEAENRLYELKKAALAEQLAGELITEDIYNRQLEEVERIHIANLDAIRKEQIPAERKLQDLLLQQTQRRQQEAQALEQKYAAMKKDYFGDNPAEAQQKYKDDLAMLDIVYQRELAAAGQNAAEKLRIDEAYEKAKLALKKKYGLLDEEDTRNAMEKGIAASVEWLNSDGGKALTGTMSTLTNGMSSIFSQLSSLMQAELEIQTAAINKRYDAEISRAEGNSYKVKKLEKQKEAEIAKAKNEANRKMFAMQVIQAVAQTATNALSAYGSAAAIPVVGYILAPIAAAMAVAAGAIQIAAIKKQQQASEAQGYAEGGFTPPGGKYEEAGVVHKGEWVASQALVNNPRTRPLLEALDYAQRTNTIGSIRMSDVSRTITAPAVLAAQPSAAPTIVNNTYNQATPAADNTALQQTIDRLNDKLDAPLGAIVTVAGDYGIERAKEEYDLLMRNKSPKSKK